MINDTHIKQLTYEYEKRISHLEQRILELETELYKKDCIIKSSSNSVRHSKNNRQDIIDAIHYIKNKPIKTKQDKESLYSLEKVLRNLK